MIGKICSNVWAWRSDAGKVGGEGSGDAASSSQQPRTGVWNPLACAGAKLASGVVGVLGLEGCEGHGSCHGWVRGRCKSVLSGGLATTPSRTKPPNKTRRRQRIHRNPIHSTALSYTLPYPARIQIYSKSLSPPRLLQKA